MKAIIDGYKYDTDISTLICQVSSEKTNLESLYCNRKMKYFVVLVERVSPVTGEYTERIIPITKVQAMQFLTKHKKVTEYEQQFGELPEAEGEDYIPDGAELITDADLDGDNTVPVNKPAKRRSSPKQTLKLSRAVSKNDVDSAVEAIMNGAAVRQKHLRVAVVNQNLDLVELLCDAGVRATFDDISTAILLEDMKVFKAILPDELKRSEYAAIRKYAAKYNKQMFVDYISEKM